MKSASAPDLGTIPAARHRLVPATIGWTLFLGLFTAVILLPIIWMITTAIKPSAEIFASGLKLFPRRPTWVHFDTLIRRFNIPIIIYNTFLVAVGLTVTQVFTSVLAAYGFARYTFPLRKVLFFACIAQMFIPIQVVMVSNYLVISSLRLLNTLPAVILPQIALGLGIFFLYQHIRVFPQPIIDCARIDGAGELTILFRIVLPVIKPIVAAIGIIIFINSWNQYVWPTLVLRNPEQMTLPIWLRQFMHAEAGTDFGLLMAASFLGVAPALGLYVVARQTIMDAFLESGLKG